MKGHGEVQEWRDGTLISSITGMIIFLSISNNQICEVLDNSEIGAYEVEAEAVESDRDWWHLQKIRGSWGSNIWAPERKVPGGWVVWQWFGGAPMEIVWASLSPEVVEDFMEIEV